MKKKLYDCLNLSTKRMFALSVFVFVISILPLIVLGSYNMMCYDDYFFGVYTHDAWNATHSIKNVIHAAIQQANSSYMTWQGCWIITFISALHPANFIASFTWFSVIFSIILFTGAAFLLNYQLYRNVLGGSKYEALLTTVIILFAFYQLMDSPYEGLYQYNAVVAYMFPQECCFWGIASLIKLIKADKPFPLILWTLGATIGFGIGASGTYITALQTGICFIFILVFCFFYNKKKTIQMIFPFIIWLAAFCINIFAPGNMVRKATGGYSPYGPFKSVMLSFYHAILYMIKWSPALFILIILALIPILWKMTIDSQFRFQYPGLVTLGCYCLYSAMFTPMLFATGEVGMPRTNNVIQAVYYILLIFSIAYWLGWINHNHKECGQNIDALIKKAGNRVSFIFFLLILFICIFTMDKNTYTSISAFRSIAIGEASAFKEESLKRYERYSDTALEDVTVPSYVSKPALFDFIDISDDPNYWINLEISAYFHKHSIRLEEP